MKQIIVFILMTMVSGFGSYPTYAQQVFEVDSWDDLPDANTGDGWCSTWNGQCTLRAAIQQANASPNGASPDVIRFTNIPIIGWLALISLGTYLPPITDPVVIDGTTASGSVIIDGSGASNPTDSESGLILKESASGSTIRGLSLGNFAFSGIHINDSHNNVIEKSHIGALSDGTDYGNRYGIWIYGNNNRIGGINNSGPFGVGHGRGNTIGFNDLGIYITNSDSTLVRGNYIGTDRSDRRLGNEIGLYMTTAIQTVIGGPTPDYGNRIGFNEDEGLFFTSSCRDNTVRNNFIGTDEEGNNLGNGASGVRIYRADDNTIGGRTEYGNVIGFNGDGIRIGESDENRVRGNFIGTDRDGRDLGNLGPGVVLEDYAKDNNIGYRTDADIPVHTALGNIIAYNDGPGVAIEESDFVLFDHPERNTIRGNRIHDNVGGGIDLGADGPTANDADDSDDGPNQLLNTPDISRQHIDEDPTPKLVLRYTVSSDSTLVNYPLTVDFYFADSDLSGQGMTYLGTDLYVTPDSLDKFAVDTTGLNLDEFDVFVATATDALGNTSEFSLPSGTIDFQALPVIADGDAVDAPAGMRTGDMGGPTTVAAYPNPFNPQTTITLALRERTDVRIAVYDALGRQVATLHEGALAAGQTHTFRFDGSGLASGVYLLRVDGGALVETRRLMLVK